MVPKPVAPPSRVQASLGGTVELQGTVIKGLVLKPGTFNLYIAGEPREVEFPRDVVLDAYGRLKARVAAGDVEIHLTHPQLFGLPIRFGLVKEVRVDRDKGELWLTRGEAFPEMEKLLTAEARESIKSMALSMDAGIRLRRRENGGWRAVWVDIDGVSVVGAGAVHGSWITSALPEGLAASAPVHAVLFAEFVRVHSAAPLGAASRSLASGTRGANDQPPAGVKPTMKKKPEDANPPAEEAQETNADTGEEPSTGADTESSPAKAAAAAVKELKARLATSEKLAQDLEAKLKAAATAKDTLEARLATTEGAIKTLAAKAKALEDEKAEAAAVRDVEDAIVRARKAVPAEKDALLKVRRQVGSESFNAMIATRPTVGPPIGEKGFVPNDPSHADPVVEAAATVQRYGVEGVFMAHLHEADPALRVHLAASHPTHPLVRKHLKEEIATIAAAKAASGAGR